MATLAEPEQDFTRLPEMPEGVFTAPLKRPDHLGEHGEGAVRSDCAFTVS